MNSVHNMSVDARTQHRPTRERALFSPPHTESSLCRFDRICYLCLPMRRQYSWGQSAHKSRYLSVPSVEIVVEFIGKNQEMSSKNKSDMNICIRLSIVIIHLIWYSIIIICCDQPIIWFMHLSSINLNQPISLYHYINFFPVLWQNIRIQTLKRVYFGLRLGLFGSRVSLSRWGREVMAAGVWGIWSDGIHSLDVRDMNVHTCSHFSLFFFFFQCRILAIHIQDGSSHLNKSNRETSSRLSQSFVSQVILDPVNVDEKMLTIVISYLAWFPNKVQHWSTLFLLGVGRHTSSIFTKLSLRFTD